MEISKSATQNIFGVDDLEAASEAARNSMDVRHGKPGLLIISMLSDLQEMQEFGSSQDDIRKRINLIKYLIDELEIGC